MKTPIRPRKITREINEIHESDADSEGEEREIRVKKAPTRPSQEEVNEHMSRNHYPFRAWCKHCVAGQGTNEAHKRDSSEKIHPTVSIDYAFFSESTEERKKRKEKEESGEKQ